MKVVRFILSMALLVATCLVAACDDETIPSIMTEVQDKPDGDVAEGTVQDKDLEVSGEEIDIVPPDVEPAEQESQPEIDVTPDEKVEEEQVTPPVSLSFCISTKDECNGESQVSLTMEDDQNAGKLGLQSLVTVTCENVETGLDVQLWIDSILTDTYKKTGAADVFSFDEVTLSHKPDGHIVEVRIPGVTFDQKKVLVTTGSCGISLAPPNDPCFGADAEPETPGFQVAFTVSNDGTDCDEAWLDIDGKEIPSEHALIDETGAATIAFTVSPDDTGLVCQAFTVNAHVTDSKAPERQADLGPIDYMADNATPIVTIETPVKGTYNLEMDEDGDAANGIQATVSGTVEFLGPDGTVELWVNAALVESAAAPEGTFTFVLTMPNTGLYSLEVRGVGCCAKVGAAFKDLTAIFSLKDVEIGAPASGSTLWAKADGDLGTALKYETDFSVLAPAVKVGETLAVQCKQDAGGAFMAEVGSLVVAQLAEDFTYAVPVVLDVEKIGNKILCQAVLAAQGATSKQIALTVALPAPKLVLTSPADGEAMDPQALVVAGEAENLLGQQVSIYLLGEENYDWAVEAGADGFYFETAQTEIEDGAYALTVEAEDLWGNVASEQAGSVTEAAVILDGSAPLLSFIFPENEKVLNPDETPDAIPGDAMPGYQIEVLVGVANEPDAPSVELALLVNGTPAPLWEPPTDQGGGLFQAKFGAVTLFPGSNVLSLSGVDNLGHEAGPLLATVTLNAAMPRIEFVSPAKDVTIATLPFQVVGSAKTQDGLLPLEDAEVTLMVDGVDYATLNAGPGGLYNFEVANLTPDVGTKLQLKGKHATYPDKVSYSDVKQVTLKSVAPTVTIDYPVTDTLFNLAQAGCAKGVVGCQLSVLATTGNVENSQTATLDVQCTGQPAQAPTTLVKDNKATWTKVQLPNNSTCTLVGNVEDVVGQKASSAPVVVTIDRTAPKFLMWALPQTSVVLSTSDKEPDKEFFQYVVAVKIAGLEVNSVVTLQVTPKGGQTAQVEATLDKDVDDAGTYTVYFPQYAFVPGLNTLTVVMTDKAGNTTKTSKDFQFITEPISVAFATGESIAFKECEASSQCGKGVCAPAEGGMRCVTPFGANQTVVMINTKPDALFNGTDNLRVCSDHGDVGGELCGDVSQGEFHVLKLADIVGGFEGVVFSKQEMAAVPAGFQKLAIEAKRGDTGEWVSSLGYATETGQMRYVYADAVAPTVAAPTFPGDTKPAGDKWLNLLEAVAGSVFEAFVGLGGAEYGSSSLTVNNTLKDKKLFGAVSGDYSANVELSQGYNNVCAEAADVVGNKSSKLCSEANVDTLPPTLSFLLPKGVEKLLKGSSPDVKVKTEPNLDVHLDGLHNGQAVSAVAKADAQGTALFQGFMAADGIWEVAATAQDAALNTAGPVATTPAQILVDRTGPTVTIQAPADGTDIPAGQDADPVAAGIQVAVQFATTDTAAWQIYAVRCLDAAYTDCEAPTLKTPVKIDDLGNGSYNALITLAKMFKDPEYRILQVEAQDANGNGMDAPAQTSIVVHPGGCILEFANLPDDVFINNSKYCPVPGQNCDTTELAMKVNFGGACGAAQQLVLYVNDMPEYSSTELGQGSVQFKHEVAHGEVVTFEARLVDADGATLKATGQWTYTVDLTDPVPTLVSPAGDPIVCNKEADGSEGQEGCQLEAAVHVDGDNLIGGQVQLLRKVGADEFELVAAPMAATPFDGNFDGLTLLETVGQQLVLRATDKAGNVGEVIVGTLVDVTPPAELVLSNIDPAKDVNRRRPAVVLHWNAVADDGLAGENATEYQFRYSKTPILSEADFDDPDKTCDPADIKGHPEAPLPVAPGGAESFEISGPDVRAPSDPCRFIMGSAPEGTTYYFAARAVDDVGNASPFLTTALKSTSELTLKYSKVVTNTLAANMGVWIFDLGDLNADGMAEYAVGGDTGYKGFCIVKGNQTVLPVLDLATAPGTQVKCVKDSFSSNLGFWMFPVGDVNGDGTPDVAAKTTKLENATQRTDYRIYLGDGQGFVQTPAAAIISLGAYDAKSNGAKAGNFNGDATPQGKPLFDVAVSAPATNQVFIVPGNAVWKATAPVTIDMKKQADLDAWSVVTVNGLNMPTNPAELFGDTLAGAGNILLDNNGTGTQYDDLAIAKTNGNSAIYILKGRTVTKVAVVSISMNLTEGGSEDAKTVKLIPDSEDAASWWMGIEMAGEKDLDGDGIPDLLAGKQASSQIALSSLYLLYGKAVQGQEGKTIQIQAATPAGDGILMSANGMRIVGAYSMPLFIGNFDGGPVAGKETSMDMAYRDLGEAANPVYGEVYVRLNQQSLATDGKLLPTVDLTITDPFTPGNTSFASASFVAAGDVNLDGFPDLVVGVAKAGYVVLVY